MNKIKLKVVPPPPQGSCAVLKIESKDGKFFKGKDGDSTLCCGSCGNILSENVFKEQVRSVVLLCKCGNYNVVPLKWTYKLVDIKHSYNFYLIILGVILMFSDKIVSSRFGNMGFWIGFFCAVAGVMVSLLWNKKIKYFE